MHRDRIRHLICKLPPISLEDASEIARGAPRILDQLDASTTALKSIRTTIALDAVTKALVDRAIELLDART